MASFSGGVPGIWIVLCSGDNNNNNNNTTARNDRVEERTRDLDCVCVEKQNKQTKKNYNNNATTTIAQHTERTRLFEL
jgi:hypothetical protein